MEPPHGRPERSIAVAELVHVVASRLAAGPHGAGPTDNDIASRLAAMRPRSR